MNKNISIVGRKKELLQLEQLCNSAKSEFLAVYGRRRVGKTFLIREFFDYQFDFQISGLANATSKQQLFNFHAALSQQSKLSFSNQPNNWLEAFQCLMRHLESIKENKKKIIFFDEMPWFDTKNSDFIIALEHFWNSWATNRKDIVLIACGSAASWMMNKLINHSGGLHNRVTQKMKVEPFSLQEVEALLHKKNCMLNRYQIVELYMAIGGIPYYLDAIKPEFSAAQNIQYLFFDKNAFLANEFSNLYRSLFKKHEIYEKIVEILATRTYGMQRNEIVKLSKISSGGTLSKVLADLQESGFIDAYPSLDNKNKNTVYRLADFYSNFYFKFIKNSLYKGENTWINLLDNPSYRAWQGYTFEQICIDHIIQIKKSLGISGVLSRATAWRGSIDEQAVQIDLIIDRRDQVINLCEIKFSLHPFVIQKDYAEKLRAKVAVFKQLTQTPKAVFLTLISTYGITQNCHSLGLVQNEVKMDDLFC